MECNLVNRTLFVLSWRLTSTYIFKVGPVNIFKITNNKIQFIKMCYSHSDVSCVNYSKIILNNFHIVLYFLFNSILTFLWTRTNIFDIITSGNKYKIQLCYVTIKIYITLERSVCNFWKVNLFVQVGRASFIGRSSELWYYMFNRKWSYYQNDARFKLHAYPVILVQTNSCYDRQIYRIDYLRTVIKITAQLASTFNACYRYQCGTECGLSANRIGSV